MLGESDQGALVLRRQTRYGPVAVPSVSKSPALSRHSVQGEICVTAGGIAGRKVNWSPQW